MNRNHSKAQVLLLLLGSVALGCSEDIDSDDVRTSGFYAEFEALASGDGMTHVSARLKTGGEKSNTFADLQGEDRLLVSSEGATEELNRSGSRNRDPYEAQLEGDGGGKKIIVAFERGELDAGAPDSEVRLPAPFSIQLMNLEEGEELVRGTDLQVVWDDNDAGRIHWTLDGDCIWSEQGTNADDGSLTIDADDIGVQSLDEGESCEVTLTLQRIEEGTVDDAFGGGVFRAIQRRSTTFLSLPAASEIRGMGGATLGGGSGGG